MERFHIFFHSMLVLALLTVAAPLTAQEKAQTTLEDLYKELDSLFNEETVPDDLFAMVDSLLVADDKVSALNVRVGYVSTVVSAGRTFGIEQYGITSSVNYFHHSGLFTGVTGYWSNEYSPGYYLTNLSVGYSKTLFNKLTTTVSHDFYLYHDTLTEHSFDKSFQAGLACQFRHADVGVDYAFLYGAENAHRITATANAHLKFRTRGLIDAVILMPGASMQWGNANVFYVRQPRSAVTDLYHIVRGNDYPRLSRRGYIRLTYLLEKERMAAATYFLARREYTPSQIDALVESYYNGQIRQNNAFGLMNYSISFPVVIRSGRWSLLANYTYNVPQALPGESYEYEPGGYFSSSLSYLFYWKSQR